jgi:U3 small nucleolar RNA-associated protein 11
MSSLRNVVKRREHKERGQLRERRKLGLLEKHKDYVKRARDYNQKQKRLKTLQLKAALRNPDEFYYRMASTTTEKGVHVSTHNHQKQLDSEALRSLKTQDLAYLHMKRAVDLRKAEKLNRGLHFVDAPKGNAHTVFVEDDQQVDSFDVAKHFDTAPELADRAFNRIRTKDLQTAQLPDLDANPKKKYKMQVERDAVYREMRDRLARAKKIGQMSAKLDLERKVQAKGKKVKVKAAETGMPAVYRWKQQRQK